MEIRKKNKIISVMIKPASSLCNLRCRYCFYNDISENRTTASFGIMDQDTADLICRRISEYLDNEGTANISFQGGEPTAAGLDFFRYFVSRMKEYPRISVNYSIQTNGTLITEEWADFFSRNAFLAGISLDGYQTNMDSYRLDENGRSVFLKVLNAAEMLAKKKVEFNILTVVTKELSRHPRALYQFYRKHKFRYIQLIPCLPGIYAEDDPYALTAEEYASFYTGFFDAWQSGTEKGYRMSVNLFDNLYEMLSGRMPYQCGMIGRCALQLVIESNGDVYPCDFYCLDDYRLGNLRDHSFREIGESEKAAEFLRSSSCMKQPCRQCRYISFCSGGCRRQNVCWLTDETCAYRTVLDHILPVLSMMHR